MFTYIVSWKSQITVIYQVSLKKNIVTQNHYAILKYVVVTFSLLWFQYLIV